MPALAAGDFTVSFWICPLDLAPAGILAQGNDVHGWAIELTREHTLRFRVKDQSVQTPVDAITFGQWYHIAAIAHAGGKLALYVNGSPIPDDARVVAVRKESENLPFTIGSAGALGPFYSGLIDDVRVFTSRRSASMKWRH